MHAIFTQRVIAAIRTIPKGRVATYGVIAACAGNHRAARQVARILHSCSDREDLPWHRVINQQGRISLPDFGGYALQKQLLQGEGIVFDDQDRIDLERFMWNPQL